MDSLRPLLRPAVFLAAFTLTAGIVLWMWSSVSGYYLAALVSLVNYGLSLAGTPLALQEPDLGPQTIAYPGMAGGVALLLATPSRPVAWKLRWLAALLIVLSLLHVSLLFAEAQVASLQHQDRALAVQRHTPHNHGTSPAETGPRPNRQVTGRRSWAVVGHAVGLLEVWGTPGMVLLVWFFAASPSRPEHPP